MVEYAPDAINQLFQAIKAGIPSALMGGVIGDSAHTYGYHRGRNYVSSSDYSVQYSEDKQGHGEAACGLDISWNKASDHYLASQRLLNAKNDNRMSACREFFGSTDGVRVCGWDYKGGYAVTSDSSHLWHVHLSILRKYADDYTALAPIAEVITGGATSGGGNTGNEDEVPSFISMQKSEAFQPTPNSDWAIKFDKQSVDEGDKVTNPADVGRTNIKLDGARFVSTFTAKVEGMPEGKSIYTCIGWANTSDGKDTSKNAWREHITNGGAMFIEDTRADNCKAGKAIKLFVRAETGCKVSAADWRVLYWPT
jgi:hypothetical protein